MNAPSKLFGLAGRACNLRPTSSSMEASLGHADIFDCQAGDGAVRRSNKKTATFDIVEICQPASTCQLSETLGVCSRTDFLQS